MKIGQISNMVFTYYDMSRYAACELYDALKEPDLEIVFIQDVVGFIVCNQAIFLTKERIMESIMDYPIICWTKKLYVYWMPSLCVVKHLNSLYRLYHRHSYTEITLSLWKTHHHLLPCSGIMLPNDIYFVINRDSKVIMFHLGCLFVFFFLCRFVFFSWMCLSGPFNCEDRCQTNDIGHLDTCGYEVKKDVSRTHTLRLSKCRQGLIFHRLHPVARLTNIDFEAGWRDGRASVTWPMCICPSVYITYICMNWCVYRYVWISLLDSKNIRIFSFFTLLLDIEYQPYKRREKIIYMLLPSAYMILPVFIAFIICFYCLYVSMLCQKWRNKTEKSNHWLTLIPAWIKNHLHSKVWDGIFLSIPNLQRVHRGDLGMDKWFHLTLYNGFNYLSMLG